MISCGYSTEHALNSLRCLTAWRAAWGGSYEGEDCCRRQRERHRQRRPPACLPPIAGCGVAKEGVLVVVVVFLLLLKDDAEAAAPLGLRLIKMVADRARRVGRERVGRERVGREPGRSAESSA